MHVLCETEHRVKTRIDSDQGLHLNRSMGVRDSARGNYWWTVHKINDNVSRYDHCFDESTVVLSLLVVVGADTLSVELCLVLPRFVLKWSVVETYLRLLFTFSLYTSLSSEITD